VPIVLKSWTLKLLERSGPVKARAGIALPLSSTFHIYMYEVNSVKSDLHDMPLKVCEFRENL
jgi:hypothetical protein